MRFNTLLFDLDETLYPSSSGLWMAIRERINAFLLERMGFPPEQIEILREKYFREYGTTLRGLQANYSVDMEEYLAFVHDVPLEKYLHPDPQVRQVIAALPARKYIFTNADNAHANRVLDVLDLQGLFDGILDVHTISPYCKPMPESLELALQAAGSPPPAGLRLAGRPGPHHAGRPACRACSPSWWGRMPAGEDADASPGKLDRSTRVARRANLTSFIHQADKIAGKLESSLWLPKYYSCQAGMELQVSFCVNPAMLR